MGDILVFDNVVDHPQQYRADALTHEFRTYTFAPDETFHGIGLAGRNLTIPNWITSKFPNAIPKVNFFRRSPEGQREPTFIHSDDGMGDWTAILYLNDQPVVGDGTKFWKHKPTGRIQADRSELTQFEEDFPRMERWEPWHHVRATFNRLLMFPAPFFHSRAIFENYGASHTEARLIQVVFGTGSLA